MMADATTSIQKYEGPREFSLAQYDQQKFNVLSPTQTVQAISPHHQWSVSVVKLDPRQENGDVYSGSFCKGDERALSKNGILKLAEAARVEFVPELCRRLDDMKNPDYACFEAVCRIKRPDGGWMYFKASKEVDTSVLTGKDRTVKREHKASNAETKAMLRAVRAALKLKQKYTTAELAKPFAVPHLDFAPDYNDPEVKRLMLAAAAGAQSSLYGTQPALPAGEVLDAQAAVQEMRGDGGRRVEQAIPVDAEVVEAPDDDDDDQMTLDDMPPHDAITGELVDPLHDMLTAIDGADDAALRRLIVEANETRRAGRYSDEQWQRLCRAVADRKAALQRTA